MKLLTVPFLLIVASLTVPTSSALSAISQPAATFSAGGGEVSNGSYTLLSTIGQPGIVGTSGGDSYTASHGFLSVMGDGFKILYPVITATPGSLTFTLVSGTSNDLPLAISNSGGSTLAWTVTKRTADDIFTFTPACGSNSGSITVTANAAGLTAGTYQNSLTISGTGIEQTAQVQLDLTVSPLTYTLAVTLKLVTPEKGGGTVTSTVPDSRLSCQRTGGTSDVTCMADFPQGSTVTLRQSPDSNTTWGTWGAPGCGTSQDCQITLNSSQGTTMTLPYAAMSKVNSTSNGYEALYLAYGNAAATDTIWARGVVFPAGDWLMNTAKTITLKGGRDAWYKDWSGAYTTLSGRLSISNGKLIAEKLKIK